MTLAERFWARVDRRGPDDCWLWIGTRTSEPAHDYGTFYDNGKARRAHQIAWELANGKSFPEGLFGCHHCDNPPCVNPAHIFPGTTRDNARDAQQKRTSCHRGHPYTEASTYTNPLGHRVCRTCVRLIGRGPRPYDREAAVARVRRSRAAIALRKLAEPKPASPAVEGE